MSLFDDYGGDSSDFSPLDLMGSLVINGVASSMAAKQPSFRIGVMKKKDGEVPWWSDARFLGGFTALTIAQFFNQGNPTVKQMGHDAATGLLNSFVATEQCRSAAALKKASANYYDDAEVEELSMLGLDDGDFFDDSHSESDLLGLDDFEDDDLLFAHGW